MVIPLSTAQETPSDTVARERVQQWTDELFRTSPIIRFMSKHLALLSCDPRAATSFVSSSSSSSATATATATATTTTSSTPHKTILIATCPTSISGGFSPSLPGEPTSSSTILLCSNRLYSREHVESTLSHEMLHWYDHCRFKVRWDNLSHHACSEIRAAALSGDCNVLREWARREYGLRNQFQRCVRRRAALSVASNPYCKGDKERAEREVDAVWRNCFNDTRPFDEIY